MISGSCKHILDQYTFSVQREAVPRWPKDWALTLYLFDILYNDARLTAQARQNSGLRPWPITRAEPRPSKRNLRPYAACTQLKTGYKGLWPYHLSVEANPAYSECTIFLGTQGDLYLGFSRPMWKAAPAGICKVKNAKS